MSQGLKADYRGEREQEQSLSRSKVWAFSVRLHAVSLKFVGLSPLLSVTSLLLYRTPLGDLGAGLASDLQLSWGEMISSFTSFTHSLSHSLTHSLISSCQWFHDVQGLKKSHASFGRWGLCFERPRRIHFPIKYQLSPQAGCMTIYICGAIYFSEKQVILFALWIFKMQDYCVLNKQ